MGRNFQVGVEIRATDRASATVDKVQSRFSRFGDAISTGLTVALTAGTAALASFGLALRSAINAAGESEDAARRLENALRPLGSAAAGVSAALRAQASELQKVTRFDDDAIVSGQAFLAAFEKREDVLKAATQAAVDFAAATGTDVQAAFRILARASQGSTAALSRYGIVIDDNIPKSERFAAVIERMNEQFGGRAKADAEGFTGALAQMGNAFGEVSEAIGKGVTSNEEFVRSIEAVTAEAGRSEGVFAKLGTATGKVLGFFGSMTVAAIDLAANLTSPRVGMERLASATDQAGEAASAAAPKLDAYAAAAERTNRILRENADAQRGFAESVKALGVTLDSDVTSAIARNNDTLAQAEDLYRRALISRKDFERVQAAVAEANEKARTSLEGEAKAATDAAAATEALGTAAGGAVAGATALASGLESTRTALVAVRSEMVLTSAAADQLAKSSVAAANAARIAAGGTLSADGRRIRLAGGGTRLTTERGLNALGRGGSDAIQLSAAADGALLSGATAGGRALGGVSVLLPEIGPGSTGLLRFRTDRSGRVIPK